MVNEVPIDSPTADYRSLLESERADLLDKLKEIGSGPEGGLSYDSNFADSSQVTAEKGEVETLAAELRDALEGVEDALRKLSAGTYGRCEGCHEPIDPLRLEAKPAARFCMSCASRR
ncbi:MAG: TraR/DksA family transcriptional regulator [Acidimicrobiales bacterium]